MTKEAIAAVLDQAVAAGAAAALAVWERDGKQDVGSCGGSMLEFDGRTLVAKIAEAKGIAYRSGREVWLRLDTPEGIRSQNELIRQSQYHAFRRVLVDAGLGAAVKRAWDYVD